MFGFGVHLSGFSIGVLGDSDALRGFEKHFFPWLPRCLSPAHSDVVFTVERAPGTSNFQIRSNSSIIRVAIPEQHLFTALQQAVDSAIVSRLGAYAAAHAGVVVWHDAAIVLPGATHAGKTTLVRALIEEGAEYCSDEFAMIDSAGWVHPWPRALMVRNGGPLRSPVQATELGARVRDRPSRIALFAFLNYKASSAFAVRTLSAGDTVIHLLENTPHVLSESPLLFGAFATACRSAVGIEGVRGEAVETARQLMSMVDSEA